MTLARDRQASRKRELQRESLVPFFDEADRIASEARKIFFGEFA